MWFYGRMLRTLLASRVTYSNLSGNRESKWATTLGTRKRKLKLLGHIKKKIRIVEFDTLKTYGRQGGQ